MNGVLAAGDQDIRAHAAIHIDALGFLQKPDTHLEAEVFAGESAHGADIHRVQRVVVVELLAGIDRQGGVAASVQEAQHIVVGDFLHEADAARAHDAAFVVEHDALAEVHALWLFHLLFDETGFALAELDGKFLQTTLTRLIANRTVERVVDEQKFHHALAALFDER